MKRLSYEEKVRAAKRLSHPERPLQRIQDMQFPGLAARRRREEATRLASTTAMERVLLFIQSLAVRIGLHLAEREENIGPLPSGPY